MYYWETRVEDDSDKQDDERAPIICSGFCSASSELSQPWAHSVVTGSWHLTWEAILFSPGLFKI